MRFPFVHEMFARVAAQYPAAVAIDSGDSCVTYEQLKARVDNVSAGVRAAGVNRNEPVIIYGEDRGFLVESMIGVLKAGAAFVPLSPSTPPGRLQGMLAECSPKWAIIEAAFAEEFLGIAADHAIAAISSSNGRRPSLDSAGDVDLDPDGLSYIFFTSGSTGRPKAIAGRLKAIDHFIRWEIETFGLGPGARVSQLMPPMFDAFMRDIFAPLCSGGTVCIPSGETRLDGERLAQWIAEQRITLIHSVPSVFRRTVSQEHHVSWASLKHVLLSGEPLLPSDVQRWFDLEGRNGAQLVNLYGPSETTMTKFVYVVEESDQNKRTVSIGKPMKGAKAIVLDEKGKVCPAWRSGDLYIRTPYRSLGYYRRPDLTNEVFVRNPFSDEPSDLVYKTGDVARTVDGGNFELLGRRDNQVKIRGVRVEIEEIESALAECGGVAQCAVALRDNGAGEPRLLGCVVPKAGATLAVSELRKSLAGRLPEYMIPSAWVMLQEMPLNATGKINRQALQHLDINLKAAEKSDANEPRTPIEEILCGIWAEVLKVPSVGVHDNFFELGGHSLLATQLMSRVTSAFGAELPLRALFEAPTAAEMAERIARATNECKVERPIRRTERTEPSPVSDSQHRIWFVAQLEENGISYNMPWAVRIRGAVDTGLLEQSLMALMRRHESLRTYFMLSAGEPRQVIAHSASAQLELADVSTTSAEVRISQVQDIIQRDFEQPFDLADAPLFRLKLIRVAEEDHVLSLTMHHIISDGWSIAIFVRELLELYTAQQAGQPPALPDLPLQYSDFAAWQKYLLAGEALHPQLQYWRKQLDGLETLELPTDRPRSIVPTSRGRMLKVHLGVEESAALRALAQSEGITLFMLLLAGMELLLWRYTGQTDLVVGTDVSTRNRTDLEGLIGVFINQLVLRVKIDENSTGRDLLRLIRETVLAAHEHKDAPFERVVQHVQSNRDLRRSPLFQVAVTWQSLFKEERLTASGLQFERFGYPHRPAKLDLALLLEDGVDGISAIFEYSAELFEERTIEQIAKHWQNLLRELQAGLGRALHEYSLLSEAEQLQLVLRNRKNQKNPPVCAHEFIAEQARQTPRAIAAFDVAGRLTYGELNEQANRLAQYLISIGAGPEKLVAVYLERSTELLVALLAVMKAGASYLPLDPAYPQDRLCYMASDAQAHCLITNTKLQSKISTYAGTTVRLDVDDEAIRRQSLEEPEVCLDGANLAYVMYTSGSTGRPKGAMVEHRGLLNHLRAKIHDFGLSSDDVVAQNASSSFDISIWQFLAALFVGGKVCIFHDNAINDAREALNAVQTYGVTVLETVPSVLAAMLQEQQRAADAPARPSTLRWIICNAEALPANICNECLRTYPHAGLVNTYGATECSDDTSHYHIQVELPAGLIYAPLGSPIAGTTLYVLDARRRILPPGVPGEAYIGGKCVGRGYLNRPALTAERFLPDPFSAEEGERLYRTGDRVKWQPDGTLEFLGRVDFQVKVRGHRIELGEVESLLLQHPEVDQAAAIVREDKPGQKELVAYFVPAQRSGANDITPKLQRFFKSAVPDYMVPSAFVSLKEFPRTANGKVDRRRLPAPERGSADLPYNTPQGAEEEILCGVFEEVLGVPRVGRDENFFETGGHSLLGTQIISRVRNIFETELPLRALFEAPSVAGLVKRIRAAQGAMNGSNIPLKPTARAQDVPLSFAQQRLWFIDQLEPGNVAYNAPFAVRLEGDLNRQVLDDSINEIIARHEVLRTSFPVVNGSPVQKILPQLKLEVQETDLEHVPESVRVREAGTLIAAEAPRPFDLERAPLIRVHLLRFSEQDHVLFVNMHHIVSDGWSMGIIVREFAALYRAYANSQSPQLPGLAIQYADFSAWQREMLQGEALEQQLSYWRTQLAGIEPLSLPTDRARPTVLNHAGDIAGFVISGDVARKLKEVSKREGVTLFMTLLGALQITLSKYTGQNDIAVGTAVANRNRAEIEPLIGFFVNTLVMRMGVSSDWTFAQLLNRVRQTALDGYQHQDVPFEKLVEELHPERDLSRSPLFQIFLVLQNTRKEEAQIPGLRLTDFPVRTNGAKFDLMFTLTETEEEITGELSYVTELYNRQTIQRLISHFQLVIEHIAENPDGRISELCLLTGNERDQVLFGWNDSDSAFPPNYIHERFRGQAARNPEAIAVKFRNRTVTYAELDRMSNGLAHALSARSVGPESIVALCLDRSIEMVVGLLGVLKSGAAYLSLDPGYPQERLAFMLSDSKVALVLCSAQAAGRIVGTNAEILNLEGLTSTSEQPPITKLRPENSAYVIYTSGSTGTPKGVVVTHGGIYNHMAWMEQAHPFNASDCILQKTPFSFDASVWEFCAPLMAGGRLIMAEPHGHQDPQYLVECLRAEGVTVLQLVPSQLRMLLDQRGLDECYDLRRVYCGGEALTRDLVHAFYRCLPWATLYNLYGPTEATIDATCCEGNPEQEGTTAPIGRPIANTRAYVLDNLQQPVPVGFTGELYLGGAGLARGYLGQPRLTAEWFVPNPFTARPGERLYRTGDRVKWLPEGSLEFLGRVDDQVKITGHRVELGEVEATLLQFDGVGQAVVTVHEHRLAAYFVVRAGSKVDAAELRKYVKSKLPEHAVPGAFVEIPRMPLTRNGKLDRNALPQPVFVRKSEQGYVTPRNEVERILCSIWSTLLNVERVGIHDNFFELGGDSILSIQVISRAREANVPLTARQMFEHQTIAELAGVVAGREAPVHGAAEDLEFPRAQAPHEELERWIGNGEGTEDIYPLTPMQLGLMFHSLYESSEVYFIQLACHMHGGIEPAAFRRAWEQVVQRHAILRTAFLWEGLETPAQVVWERVQLPWREEDWRALSRVAQQEKWQKFLREDREQGFDFQQAPLLRLALIRTGEDSYYFAWSTHHMLLDGWSRQILTREVFSLYQAYRRRETLQLPEPASYRNYVAWLKSQHDDKAEAFWREELKGFTAPTRLGLEHTGRELQEGQSAYGELIEYLGAELTGEMDQFAREHQLTLNTIVQGAWAFVLACYNRTPDVVFGATVSGRMAGVPGIEQMVGLLINTLPVRVRFDDEEEVGSYLKRLQAHQAEAREYEHSPLTKVQSWSEVKGAGLFDSLLVFENYPADSVLRKEIGSSIQVDEILAIDLTNYPLTLIAVPGKEVVLTLLYSQSVWDKADVEGLFSHFRFALTEIVRSEERRMGDMSLSADYERRQLLTEWNRSNTPHPSSLWMHELFEKQALETPNAPALEHNGQRMSYKDLNERSNQLAQHLRALGVGLETRVGICLERSLDMVVSMLATLKAGAAYVPIDPEYPSERTRTILEDSKTPVLISQTRLLSKLPSYEGALVNLDEQSQEIGRRSCNNLQCPVDAENLAYVLYTSGSTGKPKGVAIRHNSAAGFVLWATSVFCDQELAGVLASTSICFDLSVFEIFVPLSCGGTVFIAANAIELREMPNREQVTLINTVPSACRELLRMNGLPASVRTVNLAGEAVSMDVVRQIYELRHIERVLDLYGPTEDTVYSTYSKVERTHSDAMSPIGRPVAGTQCYVLNEKMELTPVGVAGELYLGGAGLARGYLNRPELTAERFVPNPFTALDGERLYRTGDLVRWSRDGELKFFGRLDHQVKIRGFRIELSEIESALKSLDDVQEAVVTVREDGAGEKRLVAYLQSSAEIGISQIRKALKKLLPEYMVPSTFVKLREFPLTPNGKIDRKSLPAPTTEREADEETYVAPRNKKEETLCAIWESLLKIDRVGVHDNFFELGGESIISLQVIARAREAGLQLIPRQIFELPTVAQLAEAANILSTAAHEAELDAADRPAPLTPIQAAFFEWQLANPNHYNQAVMLELKRGVDSTLVEQVIQELPRRHDALRMRYEQSGNEWRQWCQPALKRSVYERKDLSALEAVQQQRELEQHAQEVQESLDLQDGWIVRAVEYDLGAEKDRRLLLVIHHLAVDGVSWRILLQDLERGYQQLKSGEPLALGLRTTSFKEWAAGVRRYNSRPEIAEEMGYWSAEARKHVKPLPQDYDGEACSGESQKHVTLSLDEEESRELLQDVPAVYHTQINDVLLTALSRAVGEWSGSDQVLFNLEGHGREDLLPGMDLSQTVGWFTTIYPVVLERDKQWRPGLALRNTKEQLGKIPNRGFGYGLLRFLHDDELIRRKLAELPQAQLSFNYLGQFDQVFRGSELFAPAQESSGRSVARENRSLHLIDVSGMVVGGRLQMTWSYDETVHRPETINAVAQEYMGTLREIIAHCRAEEAGGYTPSDFPLANMDQDDLNQVASLLQMSSGLTPG